MSRSDGTIAEMPHDAPSPGGRIRLSSALDLAARLLYRISGVRGVRLAAFAGSLRRMRDTIGTIDLLIAAEAAEPVMNGVAGLPLVARVLTREPAKTSVVTAAGVRVDVRVVEPAGWGGALLYCTGSKSHTIELRELAARASLELTEHGLFDARTGKLIVSETEEEVYERLGLPWIPPTLREGTGEVEAALEGRLPRLVELTDIRGDLHTHTDLTDGVAGLEEMVAAAKAHRYEYYAITDHAALLATERMAGEKVLKQRKRIRELERTEGVALLHGTEVTIQPDGTLDWDEAFLSTFDIVVASVHSGFHQPREQMTARLLRAIEHPCVHIIGHPSARVIGSRPPIDLDYDAVFRAAARTGTALEINALPARLDLTGELVRRARHFGVRFAISTDAHAVPHLDHLRFGVATAQRGWAGPQDVINAYPLSLLRRFLTAKSSTLSRR